MSRYARPIVSMGAAYFAFYAGIACWGPYLVLYYKSSGLSGAEIGVLNAITPLGMAFLTPVWGALADAWSAHRLILRGALLTTATVALLLTGASAFWQFLLLISVFALIGTTASPLLDSYGVTVSAAAGSSFGQVRLWGSIGYTAVVWLIGYAMGGEVSRLFLVCYALSLVVTAAATLGLPARKRQARRSRWEGAATILRRPDMRALLLVIFLLSVATNPVFSLFGLYIAALGGDTGMLGATSAVAALSEFPVLFLGGWLTRRYGSRRLLVIAIVAYSLRILLYGIVPSAEWVVAVQVLHGCSFGLYLLASVTLLHELVGEEFAATAQGLLASAMAFGQMSGAVISGILLDRIGIIMIFRLSVGLTLLALALFVVMSRRNRGEPVVESV